jgi:hypothetical protein
MFPQHRSTVQQEVKGLLKHWNISSLPKVVKTDCMLTRGMQRKGGACGHNINTEDSIRFAAHATSPDHNLYQTHDAPQQ